MCGPVFGRGCARLDGSAVHPANRHRPLAGFVEWLRSGPGQLVGTSLKTEHDYLEPKYEQPCFLLVGNEQQGLPADYEAECDLLVKIPMAGRADSLNAAMATAIMAFAIKASWR